ncbi:MAG: hypothetical protein HC842_00360 [Cytophagales bacterium]|nr:hypothetical protein [Cytophagales bacterium]
MPHLDLQGEANLVRPYMYTHRTLNSNYAHYNQALAHPQGANLVEVIGTLRYQPLNRLHLLGRLTVSRFGQDTLSARGAKISNVGKDVMLNYDTRLSRPGDLGHELGQGIPVSLLFWR